MTFLNWYFLLFYCITLSCGLLIFRIIRLPSPRPQGWLYKALLVLALTWGSNVISMQLAVYVGGLAWGLLILIPSLGLRQLQGLIYHHQYKPAQRLATVIRLLHPFDDWWGHPKMIQALAIAKQGNIDKAQEILEKYVDSPNRLAKQAIASVYTMQSDWLGLKQWLQTKSSLSDPLIAMYFCRALGETGQLHELLIKIKRFEKVLSIGDRTNYYLAQLFAAAFCGKTQLVEKLLTNGLAKYPLEIQQFWRAIAWYGAGEKRIAEKQLRVLLADDTATEFHGAIRSRLKNPPQPAAKLLRTESYPLIAELTRKINQVTIDNSYQNLLERRPIDKQGFSINLVLLLINLAVFIGGIVLNFQIREDALLELAGFIPTIVLDGEWWRILSATFIHVNWAHLFTNLLTLYLLGGFVEKNLGKSRYLLVYILSGVGAMLTLLGLVTLMQEFNYASFPIWLKFLTEEIRSPFKLWVGASGSIMGMIGAIAVILFQGWRQQKSKTAFRQFRFISGIIILQFAIDLTSVNVSFYSHFLGLILGAFFTLILTSRKFQPKTRKLGT